MLTETQQGQPEPTLRAKTIAVAGNTMIEAASAVDLTLIVVISPVLSAGNDSIVRKLTRLFYESGFIQDQEHRYRRPH